MIENEWWVLIGTYKKVPSGGSSGSEFNFKVEEKKEEETDLVKELNKIHKEQLESNDSCSNVSLDFAP